MLDYSQHGQALILQQLLTPDTPRILVDIGAHDGVTNSNSRALVKEGWRAVLVEPLPAVFTRLRENCRDFGECTLLQFACADRRGAATIRLGIDGAEGQLSSISDSPTIAPSLSTESFEVATLTLEDVFRMGGVTPDFGVLLVDTEGLDFQVLGCLERSTHRPRIIVTEDFADTDSAKYALLSGLGYRFVGAWGADSIWTSRSHTVDASPLRLPLWRVPADWKPSGLQATGRVCFESLTRQCVVGWAFRDAGCIPAPDVVIELRRIDSPQRYAFRAARLPRADVAQHFQNPALLMSGFRACIDVMPGEYEMRIIQQEESSYCNNMTPNLAIP